MHSDIAKNTGGTKWQRRYDQSKHEDKLQKQTRRQGDSDVTQRKRPIEEITQEDNSPINTKWKKAANLRTVELGYPSDKDNAAAYVMSRDANYTGVPDERNRNKTEKHPSRETDTEEDKEEVEISKHANEEPRTRNYGLEHCAVNRSSKEQEGNRGEQLREELYRRQMQEQPTRRNQKEGTSEEPKPNQWRENMPGSSTDVKASRAAGEGPKGRKSKEIKKLRETKMWLQESLQMVEA